MPIDSGQAAKGTATEVVSAPSNSHVRPVAPPLPFAPDRRPPVDSELDESPTAASAQNPRVDHDSMGQVLTPSQQLLPNLPPTLPESKELDTSVVGRPFPLSQAIKVQCDQAIAEDVPAVEVRSYASYCRDTFAWLSRFAQEPRDPVWAAETEANIGTIVREAILGEVPHEYLIRIVECRRSLCAGEIASPDGALPLSAITHGDRYHDTPLRVVNHKWSIERVPSETPVFVQLFIVGPNPFPNRRSQR